MRLVLKLLVFAAALFLVLLILLVLALLILTLLILLVLLILLILLVLVIHNNPPKIEVNMNGRQYYKNVDYLCSQIFSPKNQGLCKQNVN